MNPNPTGRFSNRAEAYAISRPGYPEEAIRKMEVASRISPGATIADIGSGTGILTEKLLERGYRVVGVEPNEAMRRIAEQRLAGFEHFASIGGTAENTGLGDDSVDLVTVAQAFHWFDAGLCREEFVRILRPGGSVALLWNFRKENDPFVVEYEEMLFAFSLDYSAVKESYPTREKLRPFFGSDDFEFVKLLNPQVCDLERLKQLLISSSYLPAPGHPNHEPMIKRMEEIFAQHAKDGELTLVYETCMYVGVIR